MNALTIEVEGFKNEHKTGTHYTAMWGVCGPLSAVGISGCPLGSADNVKDAVKDLCNRTNMESKTDFKPDEHIVTVKNY